MIVTAAIDEAMPEQEHVADESEKAWPLSDLSTNPSVFAREAASERKSILERYTPITRTGQQKLRPKPGTHDVPIESSGQVRFWNERQLNLPGIARSGFR